ncbi:MAG: hypothetical protein ACI8WB_000169 [Phenylobacterium sp.]|jgi:hypothetical protein
MKFIELIKSAFNGESTEETEKQMSLGSSTFSISKRSVNSYKTIEGIYKKPGNLFDIFLWPPNAFVICAKFLDITGIYLHLISGDPTYQWGNKEREKVTELAKHWQIFYLSAVNPQPHPNKNILELIYRVFEKNKTRQYIKSLSSDSEFIINLITLFLAADESFKGINTIKLDNNSIAAKFKAYNMLRFQGDDFNLSRSLKSFGTVQYKHCVCQSGISLNSLSHKLAFIKPDISTRYIEKLTVEDNRDVLNLLIFPWPEVVNKNDFKPVNKQNCLEMNDYFAFFEYSHEGQLDFKTIINKIEQAREEVGEVDLVIFPESAMSADSATELSIQVFSHYEKTDNLNNCPTIVTGVFKAGTKDQYGANTLMVYYASQTEYNQTIKQEMAEQYKHHRWFLDRSQIFNYKLGNILTPNRKWWE